MKEGELMSTLALSRDYTSAQFDAIEARIQREASRKQVSGPSHIRRYL
jgi:hypothetical protein